MTTKNLIPFSVLILLTASSAQKPKLTVDEFFNSVSFPSVEISPDGNSVAIVAERADWEQQIFRKDLWLYRDDAKGSSLVQLTQSGHDVDPKWSPDNRWIAFLSERKLPADKGGDADDGSKDEEVSRLYLISPAGGEAFPVTQGDEEVHCFSWSADSYTLYFATRKPWTKAQKEKYKKEWKDVVQYRASERGDTIFALDVPAAIAVHAAAGTREKSDIEKESDAIPGSRVVAISPLRVDEMVTSPDGNKLAFVTNSINQRQEKFEDFEIYSLDLTRVAGLPSSGKPGDANPGVGAAQTPRQLTHNQAVEVSLRWANDSHHVFFSVEVGDAEGSYRDLQPHLYWVDSETGTVQRWSKDFVGPVEYYAVAGNGVLAAARAGTEVQIYSVNQPSESLRSISGWAGTYAKMSASAHSPRVAFLYSSLGKPIEVYLAESATKLEQARPVTSFNKLLSERDLPQGKPYRWKADDGTTVEGMLIYPPGKFEAKHLPMFTFIHGGPADADGNHFEADWYQWAALAATNGWLVFEPNYRGSSGYGDKFLMQIVPVIASRPGKGIPEAVHAPQKDGIADPDRLTVGGYSYGGAKIQTANIHTDPIQTPGALNGHG